MFLHHSKYNIAKALHAYSSRTREIADVLQKLCLSATTIYYFVSLIKVELGFCIIHTNKNVLPAFKVESGKRHSDYLTISVPKYCQSTLTQYRTCTSLQTQYKRCKISHATGHSRITQKTNDPFAQKPDSKGCERSIWTQNRIEKM